LLKQYARGKEPLFAGRAIDLLMYAGMPKTDYLKCLTDLAAEKNLSIGTQLAIDGALFGAYYRDDDSLEAWYRSPHHLRFLQQWATADLSDLDTTTILEDRILHAFDRDLHNARDVAVKSLDYVTLLRVFLSGLANEKRSKRFKDGLLETAKGYRPTDFTKRKEGFDYLMGEIQGEKSSATRVAAARLLTTLKRLRIDPRDAVQAFLKKEEHKGVAGYLKEASEEPAKHK
jgi:hypothetical protein